MCATVPPTMERDPAVLCGFIPSDGRDTVEVGPGRESDLERDELGDGAIRNSGRHHGRGCDSAGNKCLPVQ